DRMIRDRHPRAVHDRECGIRWLQSGNAVWQTLGRPGQLRNLLSRQRIRHRLGDIYRQGDQTDSELANPVGRDVAAAMRSTDKDNAFNSRISLKNNCPNKQAVARIAGENIFGGRADLLILLPHRTIQGNYLRVSQHSSHAVADDDVGAMVWIKLIDLVQLFAQSPRGIKNRVSGWISKNPELIMLANFGIGLQPIDRLDPGKRSRKKPVNKNQGNSIRIVGLEKVESGFLRIVTAANTTEESNQQEIGRWLIITDRRRKVG